MSTGFDILISPEDSLKAEPIKFYERILRLVLEISSVRRSGVKLVIYRAQRPFNYGSGSTDPHVILQQEFDAEKSVSELVELIHGVNEPNLYLGVTCTYDRLGWNNEKCDSEPSVGWLVVEYESPEFDSGTNAQTRGCHRIHFDERSYFGHRLVDFSKCPANHPDALSKLVSYGTNLDLVKALSKEIAITLRPEHLILVTEGARLNPANFHMVYHNQISRYLVDAKKMLQLHCYGGGYFYEGLASNSDVAYRSLGSGSSVYSDDIRAPETAQELANRLELYSTLIGGSDIYELRLTDEEILETIASSEKVETEVIGDGLYTVSPKLLYGYLDVIYDRLLDEVFSKNIGNK